MRVFVVTQKRVGYPECVVAAKEARIRQGHLLLVRGAAKLVAAWAPGEWSSVAEVEPKEEKENGEA